MAQRLKGDNARKFGLDLVGDVPWGTHLCQFYQTKEDLIDILVPYFAEGLRDNEFCMWVTAPPLEVEEAEAALRKVVPDLDLYLQKGQIEILSYKDWYLLGGTFDSDRVLQGWVEKEKAALSRGLSGLRLTGNTFWLERNNWKAFTTYEEEVNNAIGKYKMIAVCTYSLDKCNANEIIDVIKNHQFALIKRLGKWELIESAESKKIAANLRKTEKKFTALYNSMTEGVALHDVVYDDSGKAVDYIITDANPAFEKITGLSRKHAVGKKASELYGTGAAPYLDIYEKVASSGKPAYFETYFAPMQKHFCISAFSPSKGKFNTVFYDITERKNAEQALEESEEAHRSLFANMMDGFAYCKMIFDEDGKPIDFVYLQVNSAFEKITGLKRELVIGRKVTEAIPGTEKDNPELFDIYGRVALTGKDEKFEIFFKPLSLWLSISVYSPRKGYFAALFEDITERKKVEQALRESQHDLNHAQAVAKTGSWRLYTLRNVLLWSDENHRIFGIPKGTPMTYETFLSSVHPDDREYVDRMWKAGLRGEPYDIEHRIVVNGEVKWVRERAELEFDKDGLLLGGFGTTQDITERKEMEKELHESLRSCQYRQSEVSALLKASRAVLQNRDFEISARAVFDACRELIGATAGYVALLSDDGKDNTVLFLESGGLPCSVDPSLPMPVRGLRAETYNTGKVSIENDFQSSDYEKLLPGGHVSLENVLFAPLTIEQKTLGIIGLANKAGGFTNHDAKMALAFGEIASLALMNSKILEQLKENEKRLKAHTENLEELVEEKTTQLKTAERLATIGETAGMIGHDIRNPLQAIIGELYLSKDSLHALPENEAKQELADSMRVIEEQATYINKIVTDLQDYAKPLAPCVENADLEEIAASVLSTVEIPENVEVAFSIEEGFPKLRVDCSYMKRILTNLIVNAVQAMPNGGKLTLSAYCRGDRAFVSVEDTGEGVPEEAKGKMFKPLFTTKAKGQGFGLAVVKKLTEALNGAITFESEEGKGTKFIIEFPMNPPK
jgi:PAS domain S-box-containing protein